MIIESLFPYYSSMYNEIFYDMTRYSDSIINYIEALKDDGINCQFIYYSVRYGEFFDEFGAIIVDIFRLLFPWQVELFLLKREYMYFYNGPNGPIEVDYIDGIEDEAEALGPEEYFERR